MRVALAVESQLIPQSPEPEINPKAEKPGKNRRSVVSVRCNRRIFVIPASNYHPVDRGPVGLRRS